MLLFVLLFCRIQIVDGALANSTFYVPKWNEFLQNQDLLIEHLFNGYNEEVSPVYTNIDLTKPAGSDPLAPDRLNYTVFLYSFKLVGVVEPEERVTVVIEVAEHWHDPRLTWEPEKFGNISALHLRQSKVWSPTLTGYGSNDVVDLRDQDFRMVGLENNGHVYTSVTVLFSTNCALKVGWFPFDSQVCQVRFGMPIYYALQVKILSDIYTGILNETLWKAMGNSEWDLVNLTNRVDRQTFNDDFGDVEYAVFEMKLKRNPMYYMYMIVFPSFIINFLSIIGVFMKNSDTMSKLNVGLTNIMTMTFILGVMADKIPKTGSIPLLGVYIIVNLVIMIVAVGITVGIGELRKWAIPKLQSEKIPKWNEFLTNQAILVKDVFQDYDQDISPVYTNIDLTKPLGSDPLAPDRLNYTVFLYSFKLVGVVEPEERVTVVIEVSEHWHDPRLTWESEKYGNITTLHVRQSKIWSPTLTAYGASELLDLRDQDFRLVGLDNTGHIYTSVTVLFSTNCAMKVARFPFDSQTCQLRFCMPIFYRLQVKLLSEIYTGILNKTLWKSMGNSEWDLVNLTDTIDILAYNDNFGDIEMAVFELKLKRNPMYYIYMIVFPSFIINFLSIIGVFMKNSDTMSKLNVGLTNIMTMTFILGVMADKIPKTGNIPLLGIYIIINLVIMIVAVGITVGIGELRKWAVPKLKSEKSRMRKRLLNFLGDPLETFFIIVLESVTIANFVMMIVFWIIDVG